MRGGESWRRATSAVAVLFVGSVLTAGVVAVRDDGRDVPVAAAAQATAARDSVPVDAAPPAAIVDPSAPAPAVVAPPPTEAPAPAPPPPTPAATAVVAPDLARVVLTPTGVVVPVVARDGAGWRVRTPCGKEATIAAGTPLGHAPVVLDAGHGGAEPGAVGPGGLAEKGLNLAVTEHAKAALERAGFPVVLTRAADHRMSLKARAEIVAAVQPKAFVSIHHNAEPDGPFGRPGSETYYQVGSPDSKRLAGLIYEEIVKALAPYQLPWVADTDAGAKYHTNDRGGDYYGILRLTNGTTASLAELGFISNGPEEALYARPDVQQVEGEAVARGIVRFLTTSDPGSGFTEPYPRESPAGGGGGAARCQDPPLG